MIYSIPMALEDYVPVFCAGLGFYWIADTLGGEQTRTRALARIGVALVVLGGFSKATWKLLMALSGGARNIVVLDAALFPLLALGFAGLALALLSARRGWVNPLPLAFCLAAVISGGAGGLFAIGAPGHRALLLVVMVVGNTFTQVVAIRAALSRGLPKAAMLIGAYLVTGFIMPWLSRLETTEGQQWVAQTVNTVGALGLVAGSFLLRKHHVASAGSEG